MVEFRKCFLNVMISLTLFNNVTVKNRFLLLKSSTLKHTFQNQYVQNIHTIGRGARNFIVSSKFYDKQYDFNFELVIIHFFIKLR